MDPGRGAGPLTGRLVLAGWAAGWLLAGRLHRLPACPATGSPANACPAPGGLGTVSVIVPARDEAANLAGLLPLLAGEADEIIVVDDESADTTAAVAAAHGATVVAARPPAGATGKGWACWQGARRARGATLVFLDADTRPGPGFVADLARAAQRSGGLVSVQPTHRTGRPVERLSAVCNTVAHLAGTGTGARPGSWWRRPVAHGAALAVPARPYLDAGGHAASAAAVADDVALAGLLAGRGVPVATYADAGAGRITVRMYPDGGRPLWQGWTKNLAAGAASQPPLRAALVGLWVTGGLSAARRAGRDPAGYALFALQHAVLFRRVGRFGAATAAAWPVPLGAFVAMFAVSAARRLTGRPASWRGREVRA